MMTRRDILYIQKLIEMETTQKVELKMVPEDIAREREKRLEGREFATFQEEQDYIAEEEARYPGDLAVVTYSSLMALPCDQIKLWWNSCHDGQIGGNLLEEWAFKMKVIACGVVCPEDNGSTGNSDLVSE